MDRSNSPLTMTKYWPIATTATGATRWRKRMSEPGSAKDGLSATMAMRMAMRRTRTMPFGSIARAASAAIRSPGLRPASAD